MITSKNVVFEAWFDNICDVGERDIMGLSIFCTILKKSCCGLLLSTAIKICCKIDSRTDKKSYRPISIIPKVSMVQTAAVWNLARAWSISR